MRISLILLIIIIIVSSCNVTETDNTPICKIDSAFEKIMDTPCDTNTIISEIESDKKLQRIRVLEDSISVFTDPDNYEENIDSARQLYKIDPFNELVIEYFIRYYESKKIDSVSLFFDDLIKKHPGRVEPLLLRSEFLHFELKNHEDKQYFAAKEKYLLGAYKIDSNNVIVCNNLGELYYEDFLNLQADKSVLQYPVDNALRYLNKTVELDSSKLDHLFFPISQLEVFKDKSVKIEVNPLLGIENNCYIPSWYFANLYDNWEKDFKTNYIFQIEASSWESDWIQIQLNALNEPCLYNLTIPDNYEVYRFTWLRTFDHPIAVRIVKSCNSYQLYWKIGKGSGGYRPLGIKECGKRELSIAEWIVFKSTFNWINFEMLPHSDYKPSYDGATWTLERASADNFKAYNTKDPCKIYRLCMLMIRMAGIEIDDDRIY